MPEVSNIDRSIPQAFNAEISNLEKAASLKWVTRKYADAERIYRQMLERMEEIQSEIGRPIHKGTPLHMIGICLISQKRMEEAVYNVARAHDFY